MSHLHLPGKGSPRWLSFFAGYALVLFILMAVTRLLLGVGFSFKALAGVATLSVVSAAFCCLAGYWGARLLLLLTSLGVAAGLGAMYHTCIWHPSPGWSDLSTVAAYVLLAALGAVLGALAEGIRVVWAARLGKPAG